MPEPCLKRPRVGRPRAGGVAVAAAAAAAVDNPLDANVDIVRCLADFVHDEQHLFFAGVSTLWREAWGRRPTSTRAITEHVTPSQLSWSFSCGLRKRAEVCEAIAGFGKLEVLKRARELKCPWGRSTCIAAATNGHLEVLMHARTSGCAWSKMVCSQAARGGHFEMLKWARSYGCYWNSWTCQMAAGAGHMEILQWAHENKCIMSSHTCKSAARYTGELK